MSIEQFNLDADMGAAAAGAALGLGNALFKDLQAGDRFTFKGSSDVMTKRRRGYVDASGRRFTTGQRAAVFRLSAPGA